MAVQALRFVPAPEDELVRLEPRNTELGIFCKMEYGFVRSACTIKGRSALRHTAPLTCFGQGHSSIRSTCGVVSLSMASRLGQLGQTRRAPALKEVLKQELCIFTGILIGDGSAMH